MVQINPSTSSFSVVANTTNSTTQVPIGQTSSYYTLLAREWAISPDLVQNTDYSSKYYATKSHEYADSILQDTGFIAVSQDLTNIDTVATNIANVNTVANNITNINTVADISSNVTTVAGISSDVTAVNNNVTNINACVGNATNINAVASNATNINTVAGDKTNIDSVAGISGNITTVASISSDVTTVSSISSDISAVSASLSNINAISSDLTNINAVASDLTNIDSVAGNITNVNTVATNATSINTCATNISNINVCAANISSLQNKANTAGDNFTIGGKSIIAKFVSLASNVKSAIPVGTTGFTYTANVTGFVFIQATGTVANGFVYLVNDTTSIAFCNFAVAAGYVIFAFVPVKTNDIIHVDYAGVTIDVANLIHSNVYQTTY